MPTKDPFDHTSTQAKPAAPRRSDFDEPLIDKSRAPRHPNAFGCLLLITGVLFALLFLLGLRAYARIAITDIVSLAMIGFVGILAVGQLIVGVWMLRGSPPDALP